MHQTLFFLSNGLAHRGTVTPIASRSSAATQGQSKPVADTLAKHQTLDLSHYFSLCILPCHEVRSLILRDPSRFAYFLVTFRSILPIFCATAMIPVAKRVFLRLTPLRGNFWVNPL